ncbi:MAG: C-GCAxxG-C-C family protein [Deltaproteobacteria bacterium]|jgi:hypothetical protein|nr:C-GCAxxG-C-C family protein [Deltaproteobacteria bacterium]
MLDDTQMTVLELAARGYSCAQIVMLMGLRLLGRENPDLTRAMSGLAMGACIGSVCGALSGGLCLIAVHTAKGLEDERPFPLSRSLMGALVKWFTFEELGGGIKPECAEIFKAAGKSFDPSSSIPVSSCADLVARTWIKAVSILSENGLDPVLGRAEA